MHMANVLPPSGRPGRLLIGEFFLTVSIKSLYSFPIKTSERNTLGIGNAIHLVLIPDLTYSTSMLELSNKVV